MVGSVDCLVGMPSQPPEISKVLVNPKGEVTASAIVGPESSGPLDKRKK